jgi:uncharacterized small protein (DUF1192 family)
MDEEDLQPRKAIEKPKDLDLMGVEELEAYLAELEAEMTLVRSNIGEKKSYRGRASSLFKS